MWTHVTTLFGRPPLQLTCFPLARALDDPAVGESSGGGLFRPSTLGRGIVPPLRLTSYLSGCSVASSRLDFRRLALFSSGPGREERTLHRLLSNLFSRFVSINRF